MSKLGFHIRTEKPQTWLRFFIQSTCVGEVNNKKLTKVYVTLNVVGFGLRNQYKIAPFTP